MTEWLFRCGVRLAWWFIPSDWAFFAADSFERSIYEAVRRADYDLDRLLEKRHWNRIRGLGQKGTRP